jgi:hypothetical protein
MGKGEGAIHYTGKGIPITGTAGVPPAMSAKREDFYGAPSTG